MGLIDIAEVARRSGLPASTLRYYEQQELIESLGRRGLRRTFAADVIDRLSLIALGRSAGLSLGEIGGMLSPDGEIRIDRGLLAAKADEIDRTIRKLETLRDGLRGAARCPAPSHAECPTFRRLQGAALGSRRGHRE
ncbi:DNA-binding transcriptional regulator, MerR family [Sphingomonas sp. NFR04]|uniref:helix-turn-helix domain-containing protein n=1 Tax=Sphingomonas sp. NFR04 TaxID=1566283 RepID=UPI0008E9A3F4|nr:helix-turn-helix domain-containing protein [Sphingomonas sp. NFR04]SFK63093.1 DNA-binding transcriptional regulator, MerR family [Sphingomonas sp. NFR04]